MYLVPDCQSGEDITAARILKFITGELYDIRQSSGPQERDDNEKN
jgi:hypothetical protein